MFVVAPNCVACGRVPKSKSIVVWEYVKCGKKKKY
jgi:hypothetical protein